MGCERKRCGEAFRGAGGTGGWSNRKGGESWRRARRDGAGTRLRSALATDRADPACMWTLCRRWCTSKSDVGGRLRVSHIQIAVRIRGRTPHTPLTRVCSAQRVTAMPGRKEKPVGKNGGPARVVFGTVSDMRSCHCRAAILRKGRSGRRAVKAAACRSAARRAVAFAHRRGSCGRNGPGRHRCLLRLRRCCAWLLPAALLLRHNADNSAPRASGLHAFIC